MAMNYESLIGKTVQIIKNRRETECMIIDYIHDPTPLQPGKEHKLYYISFKGDMESAFVTKGTIIEEIEVDNKELLDLLSKGKSIANRRKALRIESERLKEDERFLTIEIAKLGGVLSKEDFTASIIEIAEKEGFNVLVTDNSRKSFEIDICDGKSFSFKIKVRHKYISLMEFNSFAEFTKEEIIEEFSAFPLRKGSKEFKSIVKKNSLTSNKEMSELLDKHSFIAKTVFSTKGLVENTFQNAKIKYIYTLETLKSNSVISTNQNTIDFIISLIEFIKGKIYRR